MNFCTFTGNLAADPETRTAGNSTVTDFRIAVNYGYGDNRDTLWLNCQAWNKLGTEVVQKFCKKGSKVLVNGEMRQDNWEDKEGVKRTSFRLNVDNLELMGGPGNGNAGGESAQKDAKEPKEPKAKTEKDSKPKQSQTIPF